MFRSYPSFPNSLSFVRDSRIDPLAAFSSLETSTVNPVAGRNFSARNFPTLSAPFAEGLTTTRVSFVSVKVLPVIDADTGLGMILSKRSFASGEAGLELSHEKKRKVTRNKRYTVLSSVRVNSVFGILV